MSLERIYAAAERVSAEVLRTSGNRQFEIAAGEERQFVVVHSGGELSELDFIVRPGGRLRLLEVFTAEAFSTVRIRQEADSSARMTLLMLGAGSAEYTVDLDGAGAYSRIGGLFLAAADDRCRISLRTIHNAPRCQSEAIIKGVASGKAEGEFSGLVYVAPGAQQTDARQTSRNIELGDGARIRTKPQLEIYADDVKCSHGATVGQLDGEAILYMRQRGLSEQQARRLQIEGFAGDIAAHCAVEGLSDILAEAVTARLENM